MVYPYQCRHTYASMMVSAGEPTQWVAEQMGHLDSRLVAAVYGRWVRQPDASPGEQAAEVYAQEWEKLAALVAQEDTVDEVPEDSAAVAGMPEPQEDDE